jgi:dTDP-4-amino-4,6-dideoxygalactose transaminase
MTTLPRSVAQRSPSVGKREIAFSAPDVTQADIDAVTRVMRTGWLTTGVECEAFEAELAGYLGGAAHVVAMSSCTAALEVAAAYLDLQPGARVGIPTWTFASTALSVMRTGAVPVLLDVDVKTLNVSHGSLEDALDDGLDAVVLVHMAGLPVGTEAFGACAARDVRVIEDAAHALGATDHRGRIGTDSAGGTCLSFYATKNLTCGEGGALATSDSELAMFARSYRLHGLSADAHARYQPGNIKEYDIVHGGIKANLPDVLAAMARSQLARFDALQGRRRKLVGHYRARLQDIEGLTIIPPIPEEGAADHLMLVALPPETDRDNLRQALANDGIGTSVHFRPLHTFSWLADRSLIARTGLAVADSLCGRVLSLPLHTRLTDDDVDYVCDRLLDRLCR